MSSPFAGRGLAVDTPVRIPLLSLDPPFAQLTAAVQIEGKEVVKEAYVEGYSTDSARAKAALKMITDRHKGKAGGVSQEQAEADRVDLLVEITTGWCIVTPDGDWLDVPFTRENARDFFSHAEWQWARDQTERGLGNRANFIRKRLQP